MPEGECTSAIEYLTNMHGAVDWFLDLKNKNRCQVNIVSCYVVTYYVSTMPIEIQEKEYREFQNNKQIENKNDSLHPIMWYYLINDFVKYKRSELSS